MKNLKFKEYLLSFAVYLLSMVICVGIAYAINLLLIAVSTTKITCFNTEFDALDLFLCFMTGFLFGDKIYNKLKDWLL